MGIAQYRGAPPQDCGFLLYRLCSWLNGLELSNEGEGTQFALARDLNALRKMGLILREGKCYRPNRDLIKAWIPPRSA